MVMSTQHAQGVLLFLVLAVNSAGFKFEEEGYVSVANYSSENNLPTFRLNAPVVTFALMTTGAFLTTLVTSTLTHYPQH